MKVLIVGLGSIGRKHVDAILKIDIKACIYALRTIGTSDQYLNVVNINSIDELSFKIDFAIVSNISSAHESTIFLLIKLGCPLFIEKPVLNEVGNADKISSELFSKSIISYVACNLRFHPAILFIKDYLTTISPRINEVNIYCGSYLPDWRPNSDYTKSYSANKENGGGVHLDLVHELDYCTWLFGFPNSCQSLFQNKSSLNINAIDSARYILGYSEFTIGVTLNYYRRNPVRTIEILTSEDTILVDLINNKVISVIANQILFQRRFNMLDTYESQIRYFIDCIKSNVLPMNSFNNAVEVLKLALNE